MGDGWKKKVAGWKTKESFHRGGYKINSPRPCTAFSPVSG